MRTLWRLLICGVLLPFPALCAQYLGYSFTADAKAGEKIYKSGCLSCHGKDGKGTDESISGFKKPDSFPDFSRCDQTTAEVNSAYKAVLTHGGHARGFSQIMPSFEEQLSSRDIDNLIAFLRTLCGTPRWPRGELNLPRAIATEKAFPEDEVVISSAINAQGAPGNQTHIIHEQRFGVKNQIEVDVPIEFQDQNHSWHGGTGDITLALKRVMYSNLDRGAILSLQGGFLLPTGSRSRGFGGGTTTFEPFVAFDQLFRTDTFVQLQFGSDLPFDTGKAPRSIFFNSAVGQSFAKDHHLGRLWSPMMEFLAARDLKDGAKTDWDVLPQMQVTLSRRQHVRADVGLRLPVSDTTVRPKQLVFYLLWDWQDGKLTEGW